MCAGQERRGKGTKLYMVSMYWDVVMHRMFVQCIDVFQSYLIVK